MKYICVSGGVLSGIGKGVAASSTGVIMKSMGNNVTHIKIDPYINIDAGTMSPFEHGEVFVLDDGGEADLDLGNYERFCEINLTRDHNITTGKIYNHVIEKERRGDYLGKTVQVVPHVCNEIQDWIERASLISITPGNKTPDICVIELGGTVGDIESMPFIEALRQFQFRVGRENFCLLHVSLVPTLGVDGEQKTKPTQQSIRELRALGLTPDAILCRSATPLTEETKNKISLFCHVEPEAVIGVHDVSNIYKVPLLLQTQNLPTIINNKLKINLSPNLEKWGLLASKIDKIQEDESVPQICIATVGKYTGLSDAYQSVIKALEHSTNSCNRKLKICWIEASKLEKVPPLKKDANEEDKLQYENLINEYKQAWENLKSANGVLVPGGFGDRGIEGKILAAQYARENKKPYLGICLGMQVAVIEFARNVLDLEDANSTEFDKDCKNPIVIFMPEIDPNQFGGNMRLGRKTTYLKTLDCKTAKLYNNQKEISERHRHRYEVNPKIVDEIEKKGLMFVGTDESKERMEIVELKEHPYFIGTQYHPEFLSRPHSPSPPFVGLILACDELRK